MDGDALEDGEEIALKLLVPVVRNRISVTATPGTLGGNGFVHGAEQGDLLRGRSIDEILSEELVALLVDTGETAEKILALFIVGPFRKDDVNEFIDAGALGTGCVRFRNDLNIGSLLRSMKRSPGPRAWLPDAGRSRLP